MLRACSMGKRSAIATTGEEVAKLTLPELNRQISVLKRRTERPDVSASVNGANNHAELVRTTFSVVRSGGIYRLCISSRHEGESEWR
jgi:hypothetical protein